MDSDLLEIGIDFVMGTIIGKKHSEQVLYELLATTKTVSYRPSTD